MNKLIINLIDGYNVFKSIDGGVTWNQLLSTSEGIENKSQTDTEVIVNLIAYFFLGEHWGNYYFDLSYNLNEIVKIMLFN